MATDITYSGVTIHNCQTKEFDQELLFDPTGTDLVAVRYKIGVEGHIHSQKSVFGAPAALHGIQSSDAPTAGNTPAALALQFDRVSQLLTQPRGNFVMKWSGQTVLQCTPATANFSSPNIDVENGPKPRGLSVMNVTPSAIKVRWSIEFTLSGCPGDSGTSYIRKPPFKVINNRWSIAEGRDADFFTHRRITGTIRFAEGLTPKHAYLAVVMPGLEKGFKRESIEYEQQANGLECNYAVVDRQVHHAAPWPATHMEVTHSVSTNDALTYLDDIQITLRGSPEADRQVLFQRMIQILDSRVNYLDTFEPSEKDSYLTNAVITEHFGEANMVVGNFTLKRMGEGPRAVLANILKEHLGKPLQLDEAQGVPYDRTISRVPAIHGYDPHGEDRNPAFLFLLNCYHQDPCGTVKNIYGSSQGPAEQDEQDEENTAPYPTPVSTVVLPAGNQDNYDQEHLTALYTVGRLENAYRSNRLRVMLPLATANASGATAEAATLGAGIAYRIITYEAERLGDWPSIPDFPDSYSDGEIAGQLLKFDIHPQPPTLTADGQKKVFRLSFKAVYGLNRMPSTQDLAVGRLPFTSFVDADKKFPLGFKRLATIGP